MDQQLVWKFHANAWNTLTLTVPANAVRHCRISAFSLTPAPAGRAPVTLIPFHGILLRRTSAVGESNQPDRERRDERHEHDHGDCDERLECCYTFSASNLPSGVTATFATNPITGGASTLTLTASNTVTSGTSNVTVIATAGLLSHTTTIALTLNSVTPNTPPMLAPITNQTVNVGQTVAFTASATDTDQPPQTLTFALLAGATNATLNTNSGAFSFRPLVTQANSTNSFTLKVSDNGTPSLSATQSFSVIVNPLSAAGHQQHFSRRRAIQFQRQRPERAGLRD